MAAVYPKQHFPSASIPLVCAKVIKKLSLYVVFAIATLALQAGLGHPLSELIFSPQWSGHPWYEDVVLGLSLGALMVFVSRIASERFDWTHRIDTEFRTVLGPMSGASIFWLALMSSLVEELFFRGFLQPRIGLEAAALIFGLAHFPYRPYLIPWTIAATLVGYLFGYLFEVRGSLLIPVLAHFVTNYFNLHYLVRSRPEDMVTGSPWMRWRGISPASSPPENE